MTDEQAAKLLADLINIREVWTNPDHDELRGRAQDAIATLKGRGDAVTVPPLNDETKEIYGRMCFQFIGIANRLRALGHDIPRRAESEQAYGIHWLLTLYVKHGADWRKAADEALAAMAKENT